MSDFEALSILGVPPAEASEERVKRAYRLLVKKYHPDVYHGDDLHAAIMHFHDITCAYNYLCAHGFGNINCVGLRHKTLFDLEKE